MPYPTDVAKDAGLWAEVEALVAPHRRALAAAIEYADQPFQVPKDNDGLVAINDRLRELATTGRAIEEARKVATSPIAGQKSAVDIEFKAALDAIGRTRSLLNNVIGNYQDEQRRKRAAAEAKAQKEAEQERRRKERLAQQALEKGNEERAMEHAEAAARVVPKPVAVPEPIKLEGNSNRVTYHAEVTDAALIPREYLMVDSLKLNRVAAALKESFNIPGAKVVTVTTPVQRSLR